MLARERGPGRRHGADRVTAATRPSTAEGRAFPGAEPTRRWPQGDRKPQLPLYAMPKNQSQVDHSTLRNNEIG